MWIGLFDSGLGGLAISKAVIDRLPLYDFLYLGDTKRVPYGSRSQETIHEFVSDALTFLFEHDCQLVILACNTASAEALRKSQQEYLPRNYPDRRILGVVIPTAESVFEGPQTSRVGVLATTSTVESNAYPREISLRGPNVEVIQEPAPLLVPLIENDGLKYVAPVLEDYLEPLKSANVEAVVLGCTHYCLIKDEVRRRIDCRVISQDEIIPEKLAVYLRRHPEIDAKLSKLGRRRYVVTDCTASYSKLAKRLAGDEVELERVVLR